MWSRLGESREGELSKVVGVEIMEVGEVSRLPHDLFLEVRLRIVNLLGS